jgi:AcrR family transcriptional regulator
LTSEATAVESATRFPEGRFDKLKPGPKRVPLDVRGHQRERIQQAMIELVTASGYRNVTVRKLTKLARVSPRVFYSQFDGVEECFVQTYGLLMDQARDHVASSRHHRRRHSDQVRDALVALLEGVSPDSAPARFLLIEAYGGGPAALARIRAEEANLGVALRGAVSRRGQQVTQGAASWVVAGAMRLARTAPESVERAEIGQFVRWGSSVLVPGNPDPSETPSARRRPAQSKGRIAEHEVDCLARERGLLLSAGFKVARSEGYWGLSVSKVRSAAGLSRSSFDRQFSGVEDCYLASLAAYCRRRLLPVFLGARSSSGWPEQVHRRIQILCEELAADQVSARLGFAEILAPGTAGLAAREALITEAAAAWRRTAAPDVRPDAEMAEATVAALWSAIESAVRTGADRLPAGAATFSNLLVAPVLRGEAAREALGPSAAG